MSKPTKTIAVVVLALILLLLLLPRQSRELRPPQTKVPTELPPTKKLTFPPTTHGDRIAALQVPYENPIQAAMVWSNAFPEQALRFAAVLNDANVPIRFFGICLDQDDRPLSGVEIKLRIRQWHGVSRLDLRGDTLRFPRTSDKGGKFELAGVKGDVATVESASIQGYEWIRKGAVSFDFSRPGEVLPTPSEPIILRFWKKLSAEPMFAAGSAIRARTPSDGNPSAFDLKSGLPTKQPGNETVVFQMQRDPEVLNAATTSRPSWKLTVTVPNGGVQLALTNMPFVAPTEAYVGRAEFGFDAGDTGWAPRTNATLYFHTGSGMYGRLEFDVAATTDGPVAALKWNSVLNPSGSRVLEYDAAKRIKASPAASPPNFQQTAPPASPTQGIPVQSRPAPFVPQPPPGFQALTNRGPALSPGVPPLPPQ